MKRAKLAWQLPRILAYTLLTGLLAVSWLALPASPAHAAERYLYDFSISEDLSYQDSKYIGDKKNFF